MSNLHIDGVEIGDTFANRDEVKAAGLHHHGGTGGAGISYCTNSGLAETIVLNGGYEDDEDHGSWMYYTGQGGNENGKQVKDQVFKRGNRALYNSHDAHEPVRIIRGYKLDSKWKPSSGYRYDGLYYVTRAWQTRGVSNHLIYHFELQGVPGEFSLPGFEVITDLNADSERDTDNKSGRREYTGSRLIRNTKITREVKDLYKGKCQICQLSLSLPSGTAYSEGAHIHPLGNPHNGDDVKSNILCLCPNCHVLLDYGAIMIDDDHVIQPLGKKLELHADHAIEKKCIRYHRKRIYIKKT